MLAPVVDLGGRGAVLLNISLGGVDQRLVSIDDFLRRSTPVGVADGLVVHQFGVVGSTLDGVVGRSIRRWRRTWSR